MTPITPAGLHVAYLPLAAARREGVLGIATFEGTPSSSLAEDVDIADVPVARVQTPILGSGSAVCEIWSTRLRVESGQRNTVRYRRSEELLFGCISVLETDTTSGIVHTDAPVTVHRDAPENAQRDTSSLHTATAKAYREIFATLDALAYPHLLRVWNYLPQINVDTHGLERYRQFNRARRDALVACGRDLTGNVPAASALGSSTGSPLVVYFLASRQAPSVIENPRQVSAYEYPPQYGPKPAFSRASVLQDAAGAVLFISGTASIVGHQTVHPGDAAAQTRETLANIEALLVEAHRKSNTYRFDLAALSYKVYVRNGADLPLIQSQLHSTLGSHVQVMYLKADICRQDLLVEIEATGRDSSQIAA